MRARFLSLAIHLSAIALLLLLSTHPAVTPRARESGRFVPLYFERLVALAPHHGGGGGGERSLLPASYGRLPKPARRQLTPPSAVKRETIPLLPVEPTLVMPPDVRVPAVNLAQLGDPSGVNGPASNGPGRNGGIGAGGGGGVGDYTGPGYGPDNGGGTTADSATGRLTAPLLLYKVEPEFSEEARKAKYQGIVVLAIEVGVDGRAHGFRVVQGLGLGLDEKAIEAVSQWKFRPALRNGRPVRAAATIEVNFRLL